MRRSAGMGGGRMLRAVGRAVGSRISDGGSGDLKGAASATAAGGAAKPARVVGVSSGATSPPPVSPPGPAAGWSAHPRLGDGEEWERVGGEEDLGDVGEDVDGSGLLERFVFETVPSKEEAEEAVSALQQIFVPVTFSQVSEDGSPHSVQDIVEKEIISVDELKRGSSAEFSTESESDWIEPAMQLYSSNYFQSKGCEKVYDAFHLLKINPSIQRMVVSLSSDKAIWDAVMKNEVVQEVKKSLVHDAVGNNEAQDAEEPAEISTGILRTILNNTKAKAREFLDQIMKLVHEILHPQEEDEKTNTFNGAVRSSFMLSVMVFVIIVVTRIRRA